MSDRQWKWFMLGMVVGCLGYTIARADTPLDRARAQLAALQPPAAVPDTTPDVPDEPRWSYTSAPAVAAAPAQRLPRGVMVSASWCGPCKQTKRNSPDLVGDDPSYPVQVVDGEAGEHLALGIPRVTSYPTFFILDANGNVHMSGRSACRTSGYKSTAQLRQWLTQQDHGVSIAPQTAVTTQGTATLELTGGLSDLPSALAAHLMHCAGPQASDTEALVGSLFDIDIDAPDWLPSTVADFLASRSWSSDDLQLTVTLPPSTSVTLAGSSVKFSK
ncbi:MAG: thioredoxin family protein, partial [Fuerstiella sp.]|nr:thioredoxin family protein [Fuerstiella sp.]